jgi:hypothetical protein
MSERLEVCLGTGGWSAGHQVKEHVSSLVWVVS